MLSLTCAALLSVLPVQDALATRGVDGRWEGVTPMPGQIELEPYAFVLEAEEGAVSGRVEVDGSSFDVRGSYDESSGALTLEGSVGPLAVTYSLSVVERRLVGTVDAWGGKVRVDAAFAEEPRLEPEPAVVDLGLERPRRVALSVLSAEDAAQVEAAILALVRERKVVGLSCAIVREGGIVDVRSYGWEDFAARTPASEETLYRWASISKPLTAIAALQLVDAGKLDLDRDVRAYLPEYPDYGHVVTSRQLLGHLGAVTHYADMRVRTLREYEVPHPWADPVIAIDMFAETPLLFEPGTRYHYSTPGYVLLGAVVTRAGGADYADQVARRIAGPLGMTSMRPDRPWEELPHRSRGYHLQGDGRVVDSGDDEITWKLAAGGWISTIVDLARFGIGLVGSGLLDPGTRAAMNTRQRTASGEETSYGLGIGVGELDGARVLSHSGGQLKTSTYLIAMPDHSCAVALMCNTEGTPLAGLARKLLGLVLP